MTSRLRNIPRRWVLLASLAVLIVALVRLGALGASIDYYRLVDDHTLVIGTVTGPMTWTGVTSVTETDVSVAVGVSRFSVPLPGFGGDILELTVTLQRPLGDRTVVDASDGFFVPSGSPPVASRRSINRRLRPANRMSSTANPAFQVSIIGGAAHAETVSRTGTGGRTGIGAPPSQAATSARAATN